MSKHTRKTSLRAYQCKTKPLPGHRFTDIIPQARRLFRSLQKQTKRRPYIRSAYFNKDKIFFDFFWQHMQQKAVIDRARRLRYFPCALELLRSTRHDPITFMDPTQPNKFVHRFLGEASGNQKFWALIKEDRKSNKKQLLSLFPYN